MIWDSEIASFLAMTMSCSVSTIMITHPGPPYSKRASRKRGGRGTARRAQPVGENVQKCKPIIVTLEA